MKTEKILLSFAIIGTMSFGMASNSGTLTEYANVIRNNTKKEIFANINVKKETKIIIS